VSDLNKKIYGTRRNRPFKGEHPYVYLGGIMLKRSWAGEVRNDSLLVAIAVNEKGYRGDSWHLRRGKRGQGLLERVPQQFPCQNLGMEGAGITMAEVRAVLALEDTIITYIRAT
jgi:hypothetical protein